MQKYRDTKLVVFLDPPRISEISSDFKIVHMFFFSCLASVNLTSSCPPLFTGYMIGALSIVTFPALDSGFVSLIYFSPLFSFGLVHIWRACQKFCALDAGWSHWSMFPLREGFWVCGFEFDNCDTIVNETKRDLSQPEILNWLLWNYFKEACTWSLRYWVFLRYVNN